MDPIISTSRLHLTLVTTAEHDGPAFKSLHELQTNEQSTWWSIFGAAKTPEDTEAMIKRNIVPPDAAPGSCYRAMYAVYEKLSASAGAGAAEAPAQDSTSTRFIGVVNIKNISAASLPLPEHLVLPAAAATTILSIEVSYAFLPLAWGRGLGTEAVGAVLEACKQAGPSTGTDTSAATDAKARPNFWHPFQKLYVRAIVNEANPASLGVMAKTGMERKGVYHWTGDAIWLAGQWRTEDNIVIFGKHLIE